MIGGKLGELRSSHMRQTPAFRFSRRLVSRSLAAAVGVVAIALLLAGVVASGNQTTESTILPALLAEVRGLRAAMEQMASAGPRVQLALGRLQLQEQRMSMLLMKQDATRGSLASVQQQLAQHQGRLADLEGNDRNHPDANVRREVEQMIIMAKREIATTTLEVQRLTAEESSISADVASEQARWSELNQRLEELERTLGKR
jgi:chromosome segregation ATPase